MRDREVARAMAEAWRRWQSEPSFPFAPDHCINGTRVAVDALRVLGVYAKPVSVQFILFNAKAYALWEQGIPYTEWPPDAWSLGVGPGAVGTGGGWDGHLCAEGDGFTLDLSAAQFNRPGLIICDEPLLMPELPPEGMIHTRDEHGQTVLIGRWPENNYWRRASGWKRLQPAEVREIVARTVRVIGEGKEPEMEASDG